MTETTSEWQITPLGVRGPPVRVDLGPEGLTLGRDPRNAIVVSSVEFPGVSSFHARVILTDGTPVLEDMGSLNGTLIGGERVARTQLAHGVMFELGTDGPRYGVVRKNHVDETVAARRTTFIPAPPRPGDTFVLRRKLGLTGKDGVEELIARGGRRTLWIAILVTTLVTAGGTAAFFVLRESDRRDVASLRTETEALKSELSAAREAVGAQQQEWARARERFDAAHQAFDTEKARLDAERGVIQERIERMEEAARQQAAKEGAEASEKLMELYAELDSINEAFARMNPLELEKMKLDQVRAVERAVVLIEARLIYIDSRTGRSLYTEKRDGVLTPNFEGRGELVASDSSGSGFVVGTAGYVITNAHVVHRKNPADAVRFKVEDAEVARRLDLKVVFSHTGRRLNAHLVGYAAAGDEDLAVVRITPFDDMPHLPELDFDVGLPAPGTEVFILGFPFGTQALQEGDTVIASTFKGIASRKVGPFLQVDAAVHPGNSGGPLIDAGGRLMGVVTALQAIKDGEGSSAIGYVIPIEQVRSIWPDEK